jgi:tetratricopeptide (TPR) repeat protein
MAQAAPEGWCTKEGLGGDGVLGGFLDAAKQWSSRYAKISGPSLFFFKTPDDEESTGTSILDVRGCTLARGEHVLGMVEAWGTTEYKIELTRRGRAAEGLPDLRGDDQTTRFCFKEEAVRDRWADALENMCAERDWNAVAGDEQQPAEQQTTTDWRGIQMPVQTVTRTAPRIARTFALTRGAEGDGMKLSSEGVVLGYMPGGPAEPAGVPVGGKVVQVNGVPVRSLKNIQSQLKACPAQQPARFFVLLPGPDSETVMLLFDMLDLDGDGRLNEAEYGQFVRHTEGTALDAARWGADTRALDCAPADGLNFPAFVRLFADTRFKHFGQAARDKEQLLWQPVKLKWMFEDGAVSDAAWAKWAAKKDVFSRHWTQGDASQTVATLAAADRERPVLMRVLMSEGLQRGRLLNQTGLLTQTGLLSASNWCVLRDGVHVGVYDLCLFSSKDSDSDPEDVIQLTDASCATAAGIGEFTVWGYDRHWTKKTWSLKAETVEDQRAWLAAINGLQFGTLMRTASRTIPQANAEDALAWIEQQYQGEQLVRLLQAIDSNMEQGNHELAGGLLRTLGTLASLSPAMKELKGQYDAKKRVVQGPAMSLLTEAAVLLDEEYTRPHDAVSRDSGITVQQLASKLNAFRAIDRAIGESIAGDTRAAQISRRHDLAAKIQAHVLQLLMAASHSETSTSMKVSLVERAQHVACLYPQHFPEGSDDPAPKIAAAWMTLSGAVVALYEQCLQLTDDVISPSGGLTRSQSRMVEDGVQQLAQKMAVLDQYRSAFRPAQPTAEEGVPPEPEPEPEVASQALMAPPVSKAAELYRQVSAQMSQLRDRLSAICVQLQQPVVLTTPEACDDFARALETLSFYAAAVDRFAEDRFQRTHQSLMEHAKGAVEQLFQQFDSAIRSGDTASVDKIMDNLEQIEVSVPSLAAMIKQRMPSLREQMAGQAHILEQKATELFASGNFVGLSQFLKELQSSPSQAVQFGQVQAQVRKKLERAYSLALRVLEQNATAESVDILAECMCTLGSARAVEAVIDSAAWRTGLLARVQTVCSSLKDEAIADIQGWRFVQAQDRIARIDLYTRCPDSMPLVEQLDNARAAVSRQLDSLPAALDGALGVSGQAEPAPSTVDKIVKALEEAGERGLGPKYTDKLEACREAITRHVQQLKELWDQALNATDAQQASTTCRQCKQLAASTVVAAEIAKQGIELALFDRRVQEVKERLFSPGHLKDPSTQHTLSKRLAGLRAVDEEAFVQLLVNFASDIRQQADTTKGRMLSEHVGESVFAEMKDKANDFAHFDRVLRPSCSEYTEQLDQITGARRELVKSWVTCTSMLCDKLRTPGSKQKIEEALNCILQCRELQEDERTLVDDVRRRFDDATRDQDEMAEKLVRDFQILMRLDCREPTTFTLRGPAIASMLQGLEQNEALIPSASRDSVSYEHAVGHLQRAIRDIEEPCIEAVREQNYRHCAQMGDCLNRLTRVNTGEVDTAAADVLERVSAAVKIQLQELCEHAQSCFREGLDSDPDAASQLFQEVNADLEKLKAARRVLKDARCFDDVIRECSDDVLIAEMKVHVAESAKETIAHIQEMDAVDPSWVADELLKLYQVPSDIADKGVKTQATREMEKVLAAARKKDSSFSFTELANALTRLSGGRGGEIVDLLPAFKKWKLQRFQQSTAGATAEWSLKELVKENHLSTQQNACLEGHYGKYKAKYDAMLDKHFATKDVAEMVRETLSSADVVEIVAGICAVWSLAGSSADDDDSSSIIRPHAVQILSIFVLLGLDASQDLSISGNLIQVKTGQGKSVLLGVLATLLAVRGHDVDCVCYSSYLSSRDEESFASVFKAFNVKENVQYGTFNGLAEKSINAKGDVRKMTEQVLVNRGAPADLPVAAERRRILLIDEVDVFFSDTFFGETYQPQTRLRNEDTDALQRVLWDASGDLQRGASSLLAMGLKSPQYTALITAYPHLKLFLQAQVRAMATCFTRVRQGALQAPVSYRVMQDKVEDEGDVDVESAHQEGTDEPEPEPEPESESQLEADDRDALCRSSTEALWKIGYEDKAQGTFDTRMFFGYETVALYFQEQQNFEEGEADHGPMDLDYALGFQISCGAFSFAEMGRSGPGFTYECILGVSGTLKCLGDYEKRIIRDTYQIAKLSVAPSIYGENRMQWDASRDVVVLADEERFYQEISLEVSKKQKRVACLVFFENEARMKSYATYLTSNNIQATNQFLVAGEVDKSDLDHYVQRAARMGNCTLFTKIHGRGLDFVCHDDQVDSNGGIHVVQTFLSEEESEEIQIRGRSARQDKNGTCKMILLQSDLEKFVASAGDGYDVLHRKRQEYTNRRVEAREGQVREAAERHQKSMEYAKQLRRGAAGFDAALAFLNAQYHRPAAPKSVQFVLDYSASMIGPRSTGCLNAVDEVFQKHVNDGDHVSLMLFNHEVTTALPWTQKAGNEARIQATIAQCNSPTNRTKLWGALDQAIGQAERGSTPSEYWIVLLTDGDDTNSFEPARKSSNEEEYDGRAAAFCDERLLPALCSCTEQGQLAGLIAITAGNEVSEATKATLRGMTAATGMEDGMIDCADPALLQEAFGQAAEMMNNSAGRM